MKLIKNIISVLINYPEIAKMRVRWGNVLQTYISGSFNQEKKLPSKKKIYSRKQAD